MKTLLPPLPGFGMRGMGGVYGGIRGDYGGVQVTVTDVEFDTTTGLPDYIGIASPKSHHMELHGGQIDGFAFDLADPFTLHGFRLWLGVVFADADWSQQPLRWFGQPQLTAAHSWAMRRIRYEDPQDLQTAMRVIAAYANHTEPADTLKGPEAAPPAWVFQTLFAHHPDRLKRAICLASVERP